MLRVFRERCIQTLLSQNLVFAVSCTVHFTFDPIGTSIGEYGAEVIGRALQSNISLDLLAILGVMLFTHLSHTTGNNFSDTGEGFRLLNELTITVNV